MTLSDLRPGEKGKIEGIVCGEPALRRRLLALGLTEGRTVEVTNLAPLGGPMNIQVLGFSIALRRTEAQAVRLSR